MFEIDILFTCFKIVSKLGVCVKHCMKIPVTIKHNFYNHNLKAITSILNMSIY